MRNALVKPDKRAATGTSGVKSVMINELLKEDVKLMRRQDKTLLVRDGGVFDMRREERASFILPSHVDLHIFPSSFTRRA